MTRTTSTRPEGGDTLLGRRAFLAGAGLTGLALSGAAPAFSADGPGDTDPRLPSRVFADDSFWYQPLPDAVPLDPLTVGKRDRLIAQGVGAYGDPARGYPSWTINTEQYSPPIWVCGASDPLRDIGYDGSAQPGKPYPHEFVEMMRRTRIPADAVPAAGTDREVVLYDADTDTYVDLWQATRHPDGSWTAGWGMRIPNASANAGVPEVAPSGTRYGTIACGLAVEGGTIKARELAAGRIDHAIGFAVLPSIIDGRISAPAVRTDGQSTGPLCLSMGQRLRLPAHMDLDAFDFNPVTRTFARAVQEFGLIVWDRAGALSFRAENPLGMAGADPYPALFGGRHGYDVLWGGGSHEPFPWRALQVVAADYVVPGSRT